MKLVGVYGAAGCGRGIMPLVRDSLLGRLDLVELVFIDDGRAGEVVNGQKVLDWNTFLRKDCEAKAACIAIADTRIRASIAERCAAAGVSIMGVRAPSVITMDDVQIGEGALLSPFVTLTSNIRIGRFFHANLYSYVEHDCVIGDFVTFAPAVRCNGNVLIEDEAYIGAGAIIRQGRPGRPMVIGKGAVVGMGAVVTRSVPAGTTVAGNPARLLVKG